MVAAMDVDKRECVFNTSISLSKVENVGTYFIGGLSPTFCNSMSFIGGTGIE